MINKKIVKKIVENKAYQINKKKYKNFKLSKYKGTEIFQFLMKIVGNSRIRNKKDRKIKIIRNKRKSERHTTKFKITKKICKYNLFKKI